MLTSLTITIKFKAYDRNDTVRNIPCDVYKSCQYDPYLKLNYTVEHFFSSLLFTPELYSYILFF